MREMQQRYPITLLTPKTLSSRQGLNRCQEERKHMLQLHMLCAGRHLFALNCSKLEAGESTNGETPKAEYGSVQAGVLHLPSFSTMAVLGEKKVTMIDSVPFTPVSLSKFLFLHPLSFYSLPIFFFFSVFFLSPSSLFSYIYLFSKTIIGTLYQALGLQIIKTDEHLEAPCYLTVNICKVTGLSK